MQPIAFCNRCRGMKVGWNARYFLHCLVCDGVISKSFRFCFLTILLTALVFVFLVNTGGTSDTLLTDAQAAELAAANAAAAEDALGADSTSAKDLGGVEALLAQHGASGDQVPRVARAIVGSSHKHRLDPRLVASIVIVESRGNPFAVSQAYSMGVMQIHLDTWAEVVDRENVNLFRIEDNVEFGVKILRSYIKANGLWEGVARYKGVTDDPESRAAADEYVRKVQSIYGVSSPDTVS